MRAHHPPHQYVDQSMLPLLYCRRSTPRLRQHCSLGSTSRTASAPTAESGCCWCLPTQMKLSRVSSYQTTCSCVQLHPTVFITVVCVAVQHNMRPSAATATLQLPQPLQYAWAFSIRLSSQREPIIVLKLSFLSWCLLQHCRPARVCCSRARQRTAAHEAAA